MHGVELKRSFGRRIQSLREARGFTQEQLADRVGRSVDTLSNIERGVYATRIEVAGRLADELGVDISELFSFKNISPASPRETVSSLMTLLDRCDDPTILQLTELILVGLRLAKR